MLSHRLSRGVHLIALAVASRGFMFPFPTSVRHPPSSRGPSARPRPCATPPHRRGGTLLRAGDPDVRAAQELRERECAALDGVIAVHKPRGPSSARVVAIVRNRLEKEMKARTGVKTKVKVGHGGTLDPLATGVLVLGIGKGCRVMADYLHGTKSYVGTGLLGSETNTFDSEGNVTETADCGHVSAAALADALPDFTGDIMQAPPAFSALRQGGKRNYERARAGEDVKTEPRPVTVNRLELVSADAELPRFVLDIDCGGGTYVRSLIVDIARSCGGRAHMTDLVRTRQGAFVLADALPEDEWEFEALRAHIARTRPMLEELKASMVAAEAASAAESASEMATQ